MWTSPALALAVIIVGGSAQLACSKDVATSPTSTSTPTLTPTSGASGGGAAPDAPDSAPFAARPALQTSPSSSTSTSTPASTFSGDAGSLGGTRPLRLLYLPAGRKPGERLPLVIELHGYGADGPAQDHIMGLHPIADAEQFIIAAPDGTYDRSPNHFWNATDTCCNFEDRKIDDVAYIRRLVEEIDRAVGVDRTRVYAVGHSNGGAMAMRLACDAADMFAAVVSIAGPGFEDEKRCVPSRAISVRHMHGTRDGLVPYAGGPVPPLGGHHPKGTFPSAPRIAAMWAGLMGCDATGTDVGSLDLDAAVDGDESHVKRFPHCRDGSVVELVTMDRVGHLLWKPTDLFARTTWDFLRAHQLDGAR